MKLPRPRFTVRRLMVVVAIVGIGLGVMIERRNRFRKIAARHHAEFQRLISLEPGAHYGPADLKMLVHEWHYSMSAKYEDAARYPWLPVRPDRPEPDRTEP